MHLNIKNLKKKNLAYLRCQDGEIHNYYFGHKIQNEFIHLLATEIKNNIIEKFRESIFNYINMCNVLIFSKIQ